MWAEKAELIGKFDAHKKGVTHLEFDHTGEFLLSSEQNGATYLWHTEMAEKELHCFLLLQPWALQSRSRMLNRKDFSFFRFCCVILSWLFAHTTSVTLKPHDLFCFFSPAEKTTRALEILVCSLKRGNHDFLSNFLQISNQASQKVKTFSKSFAELDCK